jgi:hypothetical protein
MLDFPPTPSADKASRPKPLVAVEGYHLALEAEE